MAKNNNNKEANQRNFKGKNLTITIAKRTATNTAAKIIPNNSILDVFFNSIYANLQFFFNDKNFYLQIDVSLMFKFIYD